MNDTGQDSSHRYFTHEQCRQIVGQRGALGSDVMLIDLESARDGHDLAVDGAARQRC